MKKIFKTLFLTVIALSASIILLTGEAKALTLINIPVTEVEDLDNTPYPDTTLIKYDNERVNISEFELTAAGQVKVLLKYSADSRTTGSIWVSTDFEGKEVIGNIVKFSTEKTDISWFLEKGKYYLHSKCDTYPYEINIAVLFEKAKVVEENVSTSFNKSIFVEPGKVMMNYLTFKNPNEYYSFKLEEKATVTINYAFDTSANDKNDVGLCSLYDEYELLLKEGTYVSTDKSLKSISYLLEPGTYYVKLSGMKGNTALSISNMYYYITLTADTDNEWTKKAYKVNIDTSIDYSKIAVLYSDVKESLINNDSLWSPTNKNYVALDGESFEVAKSGVYSVRITDKNGYNTMKKIIISNIDVTKPTVSGVKNDTMYKKAVTITWKDTESGINAKKTTLNGKVVKSGVKVDKEGKYTLKVYDMVGNYKTIKFVIDFTAPTAGVENGKTYKESITLKFRDNVSGIKKITIDGAEISTQNNSWYVYTNGEYEVELWDNAGNYRRIVFYIKK
jgi:hypothetical protein